MTPTYYFPGCPASNHAHFMHPDSPEEVSWGRKTVGDWVLYVLQFGMQHMRHYAHSSKLWLWLGADQTNGLHWVDPALRKPNDLPSWGFFGIWVVSSMPRTPTKQDNAELPFAFILTNYFGSTNKKLETSLRTDHVICKFWVIIFQLTIPTLKTYIL